MTLFSFFSLLLWWPEKKAVLPSLSCRQLGFAGSDRDHKGWWGKAETLPGRGPLSAGAGGARFDPPGLGRGHFCRLSSRPGGLDRQGRLSVSPRHRPQPAQLRLHLVIKATLAFGHVYFRRPHPMHGSQAKVCGMTELCSSSSIHLSIAHDCCSLRSSVLFLVKGGDEMQFCWQFGEVPSLMVCFLLDFVFYLPFQIEQGPSQGKAAQDAQNRPATRASRQRGSQLSFSPLHQPSLASKRGRSSP